MLKCITICYLLLPSFLYVVGWLRWPYAHISLLVLVAASLLTIKQFLSDLRIAKKRMLGFIGRETGSRLALAGAAAVFIAWLLLSGTGGFGYQNFDYLANNALLKDLILQDWPLVADFEGRQVHMVYYVGYYLPAALVGKVFGWSAANGFLFAWTLAGVFLAFAWFVRVGRIQWRGRPWRIVLLAIFFCLAGGLDLLATQLLTQANLRLGDHIEPWAGYFQYSSNTALIFWVPQHTLAIWLIAGLVCDAVYRPQNLSHIGLPLAAAIIWSPFGMVGMIPFVLLLLLVYLRSQNRAFLFDREVILRNTLAFWLGFVYLLYLGSNQFQFSRGWIWQMLDEPGFLLQRLWQFWVFEFGLTAFLASMILLLGLAVGKEIAGRPVPPVRLLAHHFDLLPGQVWVFLASLMVLVVLPIYKMGLHNDIVMRGSVAALFVFWAFLAKLITDASQPVRRRLRPLFVLLVVLLIIGTAPAVTEIARSVENYHVGPPEYASVSTSGAVNSYEIVVQKIANEESFFYRHLSK